uniref:Uncharacterized protein n=1 Tax=Anolis carolinensis TaxID=28377 RepID=A0A803SWR4_ANOCA
MFPAKAYNLISASFSEITGGYVSMLRINALLSPFFFSKRSEKAATDASYVEELDGIIKEASSIEHHLISKRENVRHRLFVTLLFLTVHCIIL